jgi:hypothetical protein
MHVLFQEFGGRLDFVDPFFHLLVVDKQSWRIWEDVRIEQWAAGARIMLDLPGGFEALVLEGSFEQGGETFARHAWLRLPKGASLAAVAGAAGARLWVKTGHLQHVPAPPLRD